MLIFAAFFTTVLADWQPVEGHLLTKWAAEIHPENPWPEYPRPQLVRESWTNLNGLWSYAITGHEASMPTTWDGLILVPFPVESALSGVKKPLTDQQALWYRREFSPPVLAVDQRLLLHFGAVDWDASVWVNGKEVGRHRGGYDAFSFDITDALRADGENELLVRVWDPTGANGAARGKQWVEAIAKPGGYWYTPNSGIWQTVWLEPVPMVHITHVHVIPDVDASALRVRVTASIAPEGAMVAISAHDTFGREAGRAEGRIGETLMLVLNEPRTWSPDDPHLYDLAITLHVDGNTCDNVTSYAGLRKVSLGNDEKGFNRILLNNQPFFQAGLLDQGYWPDGIYTPPNETAMRYDVELIKRLGFNLARKHAKVESARWYYACDQLGVLVWQDMPSSSIAGKGRDEGDGEVLHPGAVPQFASELVAMVDGLAHFPSVILWTIFNEGWGQHDTVRLTGLVQERDPTRLVCSASGWHDRKIGDVRDVHEYPGPGAPKPEQHRAGVLGEFGGLALPMPGHQWVEKAWGYSKFVQREQLQHGFLDLWRQVHTLAKQKGLSAAVYTQLTDVETECNGLITYDRQVIKVDPEIIKAAIQRGIFPEE
jgi:beta-galactosidase/beta-glucuronidase